MNRWFLAGAASIAALGLGYYLSLKKSKQIKLIKATYEVMAFFNRDFFVPT